VQHHAARRAALTAEPETRGRVVPLEEHP